MTSSGLVLRSLIIASGLSLLQASGGSLLIFNSWRGRRAVHLPDDAQDPCRVYGSGVPGDQVQSDGTRTVNQTEWQQTLDDCYGARQGVAGHKTPTNIELIFPGTKWCGAGDIAAHVWDLGSHFQTDRCCREHDFCFDVIPPRTCKYGLCNNALFTKSHCECDDKFRRCLMNTKEPASISVGFMFFDVSALGCFQEANNFNGHVCRSLISPPRDAEEVTTEESKTEATAVTSEKATAANRWCFVASAPFKKFTASSPKEGDPQSNSRSFHVGDPVLRRLLATTVDQVKSIVRDVAMSAWKGY